MRRIVFSLLTAVTLNRMVQAQEKTPLVFATWVTNATEEKDALMLVESLREFGGAYAKAPFWIFAPDYFKGKSSGMVCLILQSFEILWYYAEMHDSIFYTLYIEI